MTLQEKLQNIMQQAVDNCEVAGVNLLVEQDGQEVCYCQAGMADREGNRPMSRDTIFRLYSQSKPITAAAAMILMERESWICVSRYPISCRLLRSSSMWQTRTV